MTDKFVSCPECRRLISIEPIGWCSHSYGKYRCYYDGNGVIAIYSEDKHYTTIRRWDRMSKERIERLLALV